MIQKTITLPETEYENLIAQIAALKQGLRDRECIIESHGYGDVTRYYVTGDNMAISVLQRQVEDLEQRVREQSDYINELTRLKWWQKWF